MQITRRELVGTMLSTAALAQAPAQPDELAAARERARGIAAELAKVEVPQALEPAFQFQA